MIDDSDPDKGELNLLDEVRIYLGLDEQNFGILMAGISITVLLLCLLVLTTMSLSAVKWVGRKRRKVATGKIILDFLNGKMPAYLDTGLNLIDVADCARGHILADKKGRPGERYILGNKNMSLKVKM